VTTRRIEVAQAAEVPAGGRKVVHIEGKPILLLNLAEGLFACSNVCPHAHYPMSEALVDRGEITCILHGFGFRLDDGACTTDPSLRLPIYRVVAESGSIFIEWPEDPMR
jgi:nitrite reductase/ring-hydroxylating ferredoxin subunit